MKTAVSGAFALLILAGMVKGQQDFSDLQECKVTIPINEMTTKADGLYSLLDGRQIKGTVHSVGGCNSQEKYPTGNPYKDFYTILSYDSTVSTSECIEKKNNDGQGVYDSFQGIVLETNGFQMRPELYVDDIDSLETTNVFQGQLDAWKESSLVFGVANGQFVQPLLSRTSDTMLVEASYTVPAAATNELGLGFLGEITVTGAEFDTNLPPHNCPFTAADQDSPCRMLVKFAQPVDKVVILYAATHKANQDPNAVMFTSPLYLSCSCLCATSNTLGTKYTLVDGKPGICTKKVDSIPKDRFKCDMLATEHVCEYGFINFMERTSELIAPGEYECKQTSAVTITSSEEFNPDATFGTPSNGLLI